MLTKRFIARALEKILFYGGIALSSTLVLLLAYFFIKRMIELGIMPFLQAFGILAVVSIVCGIIVKLCCKLGEWIQDNRD